MFNLNNCSDLLIFTQKDYVNDSVCKEVGASNY